MIFQTLGTPNDNIWPGFSKLPVLKSGIKIQNYTPDQNLRAKLEILDDVGFDLLSKMLTFDPEKRIVA